MECKGQSRLCPIRWIPHTNDDSCNDTPFLQRLWKLETRWDLGYSFPSKNQQKRIWFSILNSNEMAEESGWRNDWMVNHLSLWNWMPDWMSGWMAVSAADGTCPVLSIMPGGCWDLVGCWPGTWPACWKCTVERNRKWQTDEVNHDLIFYNKSNRSKTVFH